MYVSLNPEKRIKADDLSRLVFGTAQLGMNYGIANTSGRPIYDVARSMVQEAWEYGLREFDTAQAYGESERVLGRIMKDLAIADEARIITKIAPDIDHSNTKVLNEAIETSMNNLGVETIHGLMLHREEMLALWEKGLGGHLMTIVDSGRVKHIGISVYTPEKAIQALNFDGISIVQLPTNIMDRRFEKAGIFDLAEDKGKTIYIRSVFLQGLLLMPINLLPKHMSFMIPFLNRLVLIARDVNLTIAELCIGYIIKTFPHSMIVFGAETQAQLIENVECSTVLWPEGLTQRIQVEFQEVDERILNPSSWPKESQNSFL